MGSLVNCSQPLSNLIGEEDPGAIAQFPCRSEESGPSRQSCLMPMLLSRSEREKQRESGVGERALRYLPSKPIE